MTPLFLRTGFHTYYSVVEIVDASALEEFIESKVELISNFLGRLPGRILGTQQKLEIANMTSESS